jgi:hypothetical protein
VIWRADVSKIPIPKRAAAGKIHGRTFTVTTAEFMNGALSLRQGNDLFGDLAFKIDLSLKSGEKVDGRSFVIGKADFHSPSVRMHWRALKASLPETRFIDNYSMRLQFGQGKNGRLPGAIYLCVQDPHKSFVAWQFTAAATPAAILDDMERSP